MTISSLKSEIIKTEDLGADIFRITLLAPDIAREAQPGQFVMVRTTDGYDPLLARPFSVHQATANGWLQILLKVVGKGTRLLSVMQVGQAIDIVGPLGKGFSVAQEGSICLIGGGIGSAPLFFLVQTLLRSGSPAEILVLLGARTAQEMQAVASGFEELGLAIHLATDDGSMGHHGMVTDLLAKSINDNPNWTVYSCGPHPMLRAVAKICRENDLPCQVSLETMMACGMGACLGCAVAKPGLEGGYVHVCKDGPVFAMDEVAWL